ncbi:hypothetical protein RHGRI_027036 [Rhododendron griersonianum]|uniref:F-box domain-containing protein n=1 Tax=Rhododendron griersonianum TaxID=479676 RepID=A0AAV6J0N0_9ERIC|nr:hypothetical protein RHGRI_027036 [Rhododendron griersonianum]
MIQEVDGDDNGHIDSDKVLENLKEAFSLNQDQFQDQNLLWIPPNCGSAPLHWLLTADGGLRRLPTRFTLLKSLTFHTMMFSDVVVISCTLLLIQSCPNLTKLNIRFCPTMNTFEEPVVNYLEAPACMDQRMKTGLRLLRIDFNSGLRSCSRKVASSFFCEIKFSFTSMFRSTMARSRFGRKDIISDLPRNIVESILERMPVRDAARTSILSSKWRYFWTTISQLVLDDQFFQETVRIQPIVQLELAKAVEKILLLRSGPIQKFVLCLPVLPFNGRSDIDHWLLFLSRNGIKDFTLDNSINTPYEMHSCVYSCRELTRLKLINCIVKLPRELSGFQNVVELHFTRVAFGNNMLRTLLSRSGLLQKLSITVCSGIGHLIINAPNLRELVIICNSETDSLSFVNTAELRVCMIAMFKKTASLGGKTPSLVEFLAGLPRVSDLFLDSFFLEVRRCLILDLVHL